jgi:hypothetical protein
VRLCPPFFFKLQKQKKMKSENFAEEMGAIGQRQFPGQQFGANIEQVRSLIKRQKRLKGYSFNVPQGASSFNLDLSGTARILLGIAVYGKVTDREVATDSCCIPFTQIETMQFQVNNEIVIDQLDPNFLSFGFNNNEYYYIPRPLSGTDELTLKFNNTGTTTEICKVVLYYI